MPLEITNLNMLLPVKGRQELAILLHSLYLLCFFVQITMMNIFGCFSIHVTLCHTHTRFLLHPTHFYQST